MDELEKARRNKQWHNILGNWDEIAERLQCGQSVDLNQFSPSLERKEKKNKAINQYLDNKQKL